MKITNLLCARMATVLLLSLVTTLTAYTQSSTQYQFTEIQVKEIAYAIESRKLLMLDTADYLKQIRQYKIKQSTTEEIIKRLESKGEQHLRYIYLLEEDVDSLSNQRDRAVDFAAKKQKQLNTVTKASPILVVITILTTLILSK